MEEVNEMRGSPYILNRYRGINEQWIRRKDKVTSK